MEINSDIILTGLIVTGYLFCSISFRYNAKLCTRACKKVIIRMKEWRLDSNVFFYAYFGATNFKDSAAPLCKADYESPILV